MHPYPALDSTSTVRELKLSVNFNRTVNIRKHDFVRLPADHRMRDGDKLLVLSTQGGQPTFVRAIIID